MVEIKKELTSVRLYGSWFVGLHRQRRECRLQLGPWTNFRPQILFSVKIVRIGLL